MESGRPIWFSQDTASGIAKTSKATAAQYQRKSAAEPRELAEGSVLNIIDTNRIDPPIAITTPMKLPGNPRLAVPAIIQIAAKNA